MRYIPGLIPEKSRVLKDYFKGDRYSSGSSSPLFLALGWIFGVFFSLIAIAFMKVPLLILLYGLLGFLLLPPGHRFIERNLRFQLTTTIKAIMVVVLFFSTTPLVAHYDKVRKQEIHEATIKSEQDALALKLQKEKEEKERLENEKTEKLRLDSLQFYLTESKRLKDEHKIEESAEQLYSALSFAATQGEKDQIHKEQIAVSAIKTYDLVKAGKYLEALPELHSLLRQDASNSTLLYNRAICYSKTGKIREAVTDCKKAIELGNSDANALHEKINPIKKHVAYYVTRCCDGSTSNAKGRGACSHHGGVCDWNDPVYTESRDYE